MNNWEYAEKISVIVGALATVVGAVSVIVIAQNISFKKDLKKKQLDTVFQLVEILQNTKLYFLCTISDPNFGGDIYYNFFSLKYNELKNELFLQGKPSVYVSKDFLYNHAIFDFVFNPFLPDCIATNLKILSPKGGEEHRYSRDADTIFVSSSRDYDAQTYKKEISNRYRSIPELIKACEALNNSIFEWLKDHNVKDLNISTKPVNITNYP